MQENEDKSTLYFCFGLLAVLLIALLMLFLLEKHKALAYWQEKADKQAETLEQLDSEINELNVQISELERTVEFYESWQCLGEFKITYYCPCEKCSGIWGTSIKEPCSDHKALPNHTIAVDPDVIPLGTEVLINGTVYVAEDVGSAVNGNTIDIFVESHDEAVNNGVDFMEVYVRK